jgi:hypothetical protein
VISQWDDLLVPWITLVRDDLLVFEATVKPWFSRKADRTALHAAVRKMRLDYLALKLAGDAYQSGFQSLAVSMGPNMAGAVASYDQGNSFHARATPEIVKGLAVLKALRR